MKYRKLRIAWSVAWGVVAMLLCVWCVRDHHASPPKYKGIFYTPSGATNLYMEWYDYTLAGIPFWIIAFGIALIGVLSWAPNEYYPHRFSLRTLLIATTLVAVGLGMVVWLCR